jgi:F-type H+-transporting ATPase subunit delta
METKDLKLARHLARIVLDGGESSLSELRPALERILEGRSGTASRVFLKDFHNEVVRQLRERTLVIESAQPLSDADCATIHASFQKDQTCELQVVNRVNPSLIGGIKVQLGDNIYDASVANQLQSLAKSL